MNTAKTPIRQDGFSGPTMSDLMRFGVCFAPETGDGAPDPEPDEEESFEDAALDDQGAEDAFLTNLKDASEAPEAPVAPPTAETPEAPPPASAADEALVEVKVGDDVHKVAVKDLKRLFGQEAALTKRSQEVALARDDYHAKALAATAGLKTALGRAEERFKPYAELDFLVLAKRLDEPTLVQLRADAKAAYDEVAFLREESSGAAKRAEAITASVSQEAVQSAVTTLTTDFPKDFGEPWSEAVYGEIMTYAEAQGIPNARKIVDAGAMKVIRKAMLYERGQTLAAEKVRKVQASVTRPLRSGAAGSGAGSKDSSLDSAMSRLRTSGSADAAEDAFLASLRTAD